MEKHKCKFCLRKFSSGRALGGHVRSHMMNLSPPQKPNFFLEESEEEEIESLPSSTSFTSSSSSSSSESEDEQEDQDHGVEEIVQDRESEESETSRNIFCRKTTKRVRSSRVISGTTTTTPPNQFCNLKKDSIFMQPTCGKQGKPSLVEESPPISSISETTSEEDVAYCLMLLSRDKWKKIVTFQDQESAEEEEEEEENKMETKDDENQDFGVVEKVRKSRSRGKYRCETCDKVFKSYQALGGHRASHKRIKLNNSCSKSEKEAAAANVVLEQKLHECPVCFKVFSSGQALGGHKRSHNVSSLNLSSSTTTTTTGIGKLFSRSNGEALIDLNLPAPIDDEDEQYSAVSDEVFANHFKL